MPEEPNNKDLLSKLESAMQTVIKALTLSTTYTVNTGIDDDKITVPYIFCTASDTGEQIPPNSGNRICKLKMTLSVNPYDTGLDKFRADCKVMIDAVTASDFGAQLMSVESELMVYDPPRYVSESGDSRDDKIHRIIELDMLCAG